MSIGKTEMTFHEKVLKNPIQKYIEHNRFPVKMIIHIILALLTTYQIQETLNQRSAYQRQFVQLMRKQVFEGKDTLDIFNLESFKDNFQKFTKLLTNINDISLPYISNENAQYSFEVYYKQSENNHLYKQYYSIQDINNFTEPFDVNSLESIQNFTTPLKLMRFNVKSLITTLNYEYQEALVKQGQCFSNSISIEYEFLPGQIKAEMIAESEYCPGKLYIQNGYNYAYIHIMVTILAAISLYLCLSYIYNITRHYNQQVQQNKGMFNIVSQVGESTDRLNEQEIILKENLYYSTDSESELYNIINPHINWNKLTFREKISHYNWFFLICIIGNLFQIIGSILSILQAVAINNNSFIYRYRDILLGFGSFIAWIVLLNYLYISDDLKIMTNTIKASRKSLLYFLIGCMPFYYAFHTLSIIIFNRHEPFESGISTLITLFSFSFGDNVNVTLSSISTTGVIGQMVIFLYGIIFFVWVQNIFVAIVIEGYKKINRRKKNKKQQALQEFPQLNQGYKEEFQTNFNEKYRQKVEAEENKEEDTQLLNIKFQICKDSIRKNYQELHDILRGLEQSDLNSDHKIQIVQKMKENIMELQYFTKYQQYQ